jgi:eukaryotic-like serine/threonine-protein kinase
MKIRLALGLLVGTSGLVSAQGTFHGNVARTGVYDSTGPKQFGGVKWTFKTGGPIVASPAIADGVVYIASIDTNL